MHRYFFIIAGLFVIMLLSACRSSRQVVQQNTADSTTVSYLEIEKIVHIPGDTVVLTMPVVVYQDRIVPAVQTAETKRSKVRVEITKDGSITATAICKELEETVTVLEKTIRNYRSEVTEYQVKESRMKGALAEMRSWLKGILFLLVLAAVVATAFKLGFNPISLIKKIFTKS